MYETTLYYLLVMYLSSGTKGKTVKQGTAKGGENSEGLGTVGIKVIREIWESLRIYVQGQEFLHRVKVWEFGKGNLGEGINELRGIGKFRK